MIGKPYSGKPNVRFDEGELEIELLATTPALYSTVLPNVNFEGGNYSNLRKPIRLNTVFQTRSSINKLNSK